MGEFRVLAVSEIWDHRQETLGEFRVDILNRINSLQKDILLVVYPEYCWWDLKYEENKEFIKCLQGVMHKDLVVVLGTMVYGGTNSAVVVSQDTVHLIPKTQVIDREYASGIKSGKNPGVIQFPRFKLGVVVCADMWNSNLVKRVASEADILAVPIRTFTRTGFRENARLDWLSLVRTRCMENGIPIVAADHLHNRERNDVGNATIIFDPTKRDKRFPNRQFIGSDLETINLETVKKEKERWIAKGLTTNMDK